MFMLCIKLFMFMLELHLGIESFLIFNVTYTLCAKNASSSVVAQYRSILIRGLWPVGARAGGVDLRRIQLECSQVNDSYWPTLERRSRDTQRPIKEQTSLKWLTVAMPY